MKPTGYSPGIASKLYKLIKGQDALTRRWKRSETRRKQVTQLGEAISTSLWNLVRLTVGLRPVLRQLSNT